MANSTPLIFTTAKPKTDEDLDKAIFITEEQFKKKEMNGDFEETYLVGVSKYVFTE